MKKILPINLLEKKIKEEKNKGNKIVLCHGTFDLLHLGHIKHFKEAKQYGDILIVSITSDNFVNKGPNRPYFNIFQRMEALAALSCVDYVVEIDDYTAKKAIKAFKPHFYCKGPDYKDFKKDLTNEIKNEKNLINKIKGKFITTKDTSFSSSEIINSVMNNNTPQEQKFFTKLKKNFNIDNFQEKLKKAENLKVLVVGEIIIDEYVFCEGLGKSGKESVLALKELRTEKYLGGAAAVCNHLSEFTKNITLLSYIGNNDQEINFINRNLQNNVKLKFIKKNQSPTIIKKRFIDDVNLNKLLNIYKINDENLYFDDENIFKNLCEEHLEKNDLVIVLDYGHGLISKKISDILCKKAKYIALNAQINAANTSYHSLRNYKNLDLVSINQKELEHEMRDRHSNINELIKNLVSKNKIKNLIVTRGISGSVFYNAKSKSFYDCKAFNKAPRDKIGAGDAMIALASFFHKSGFSDDISLLAGSLAAAEVAGMNANQFSIKKKKIIKSITHILK